MDNGIDRHLRINCAEGYQGIPHKSAWDQSSKPKQPLGYAPLQGMSLVGLVMQERTLIRFLPSMRPVARHPGSRQSINEGSGVLCQGLPPVPGPPRPDTLLIEVFRASFTNRLHGKPSAESRSCRWSLSPACQLWGRLTSRYRGFSESIVVLGSVAMHPFRTAGFLKML